MDRYREAFDYPPRDCISAVINTNTTIYSYSWLQHIATTNSLPTSSNNLLPSTLTNWLQIGRRNESQFRVSRRQLFRRRLLIFIDSKLLTNHNSIFEKCGGMAALCGTPSKLEIECVVKRHDIDWFTIVHDVDDKLIGGFQHCRSPSIANAILSCNVQGAE